MSDLIYATRIIQTPDGMMARLDPAWQGWGPIGGYIAAIALRAAGAIAPPGHRPVTLTCQFLARGSVDPVEIEAVTRKPGSTACHNVVLRQGGSAILQAQVWTTIKDEGPSIMELAMPEVPAPESLEPFTDQLKRYGHDPAGYWTLVDHRQVDFRPPGEPDPRGCRIERWLRFARWEGTTDPFLDATRAVLAIDTHFWAAHNRGISEFPSYIAPSLDLAVWFHCSDPASEWQLVEARSEVMGQGLMSGVARVWSAEGKLVASGGGQCLVVPLRTG